MSHPASYRRILHRMGFYDYQQGLIYRHLRQEIGWIEHERRCRDYILRAVRKISPEKITVLGSGWLLELPTAELADVSGQIILADIVHPPEVREQVKNLKGVVLSEVDISGGLILEVWKKSSGRTFLNRLRSLTGINIPEFHLDNPGLVISLNILTQLETLLLRMLEKKARVSAEEMINFRKSIQEMHMMLLRKHRSILITDIAEIFIVSGKRVVEKTVLADISDGSDIEKWQWDFDMKSDDFIRKKSVMEVAAMIF
jgi:hypothetical protein